MKNYNFDFTILPDNSMEILTKFEAFLKAEKDKLESTPGVGCNVSIGIGDFVYNEMFNKEETNKEFEEYLKECFKSKTEKEQKQMLVEFVRQDFFQKKVDIFLKFREIYYSKLSNGLFKEIMEVITKEQVEKMMFKDENLKTIYDNIGILGFLNSLQFIKDVSFKNLDVSLTKDKSTGSTK